MIINQDSIKVMNEMITNNQLVDLIITDPPYKITARGNGGSSGGMFQKDEVNTGNVFETNDLEIEDWLPLFYNVLNDVSHCYIMTNNKNINHYLQTIHNMHFNNDKNQKFHFIKNLIWLKDNKIMGSCYMSQYEYIIFLRKGKHKNINLCGTSDVLQFPNKKQKDNTGKTIHDTEKPVDLMRLLIQNSTVEGDVVLDPFMGIGSSGIAAQSINRKFVGVEINKTYFDVAKIRMEDNKFFN